MSPKGNLISFSFYDTTISLGFLLRTQSLSWFEKSCLQREDGDIYSNNV